MEREEILAAAKALSAKLGDVPTIRQFREQAGVKDSWWKGKFWARWSELLQEAGLEAKQWIVPQTDSDLALRKYWGLALELNAVPTEAQMNLQKRKDSEFPNPSTLRKHFGGDLILEALENAKQHEAPESVIELLQLALAERSALAPSADQSSDISTGFVYLMKSGKHYKIGKTNSVDRRKYEIGLQLPQGIEPVHSIETDDPSGIEAYWHNRFRDKRLNGEWFDLTASDIRAFMRRKNFM